MIGHGLGAAGGLEAIACVKAINTGWLHPTINQDVLAIYLSVSFALFGLLTYSGFNRFIFVFRTWSLKLTLIQSQM